ncbi:Nop domain-containing protein [Hesseltinella vesiculosa]|uniref:Nop domain-containing protein n=1 Tax=Hesseltinella vesiculosa TaxID=101127 RepID=A0A1X2GS72_9FUNG|nr:Nop domain-containing protein [Hesseltinella vesiculosa]
MSSLADELLADSDFESEDDQMSVEDQPMDQDESTPSTNGTQDKANSAQLQHSASDAKSVRNIATFLYSTQCQDILKKIDFFENNKDSRQSGSNEQDEEYQLILLANNMTTEIDNEMQTIHKFIRDNYAPKFPELESLVLNPLDYANTVKAIGNRTDLTNADLRSILPSATIMVVTVTATTTGGRSLSDEEWQRTLEGCDMAIQLDDARKKVINYVASRMSIMAPNLTHVVGSKVAAQLLSAVGGLKEFAKVPSCNVHVIGNSKKAGAGFSVITANPHGDGFLAHAPIILALPQDLRRKGLRIVAAKASLAGRIDCTRSSPDGSMGKRFRDELDQKFEKLLEPPPTKNVKALPVPDEGKKKRRAGQRVRRQKEAYAMTELRKAQNRMAFGEAEVEVGFGDETEGLGMATKQTGKIRAAAIDPRTKVKAPKLKGFARPHLSSSTSGLATSLAFTPVQGIELADPTAAAERVKKANEKYFGDGAFSIIRK